MCILLQFSAESISERILKIGQYPSKMWTRVQHHVFIDLQCSKLQEFVKLELFIYLFIDVSVTTVLFAAFVAPICVRHWKHQLISKQCK